MTWGPVEVRRGGGVVRLGGGKQRAVLVLLVLNANRVVASERLVELLWGERPPPTAATALHGHISSLRKALGPDVIATRPPGYVLQAEPGDVDLDRFERLRAEARDALERGDARHAAERLRAALALWRGEALGDIGFEPFAQAEATRLDPRRKRSGTDRGRSGRRVAGHLSSESLARIDPRRRRLVMSQGSIELPGYVAATPRDVWVISRCGTGGTPGTLRHVHTTHGGPTDLSEEISLEWPGPLPGGRVLYQPPECALAAAGSSAWVTTNVPPGLARIDYDPIRARSKVARRVALEHPPAGLLVAAGSVWAADSDSDVVRRIDPSTAATDRAIGSMNEPVALAAGPGAVWIANRGSDSVARIDTRTSSVTKAIAVGAQPVALAVSEGSVWVANSGDGTVSRIDARTNRVTATVRIGHRPHGVAIAGDAVWVTVR